MTTVLQKLVNGFSYSNMCSWNKIKNLSIKLPVTESEEINWKYMQDRVAELEKDRVAELENYLIASGLNDYELTEEDKAVLAAKLVDGGGTITKLDIYRWLLERGEKVQNRKSV